MVHKWAEKKPKQMRKYTNQGMAFECVNLTLLYKNLYIHKDRANEHLLCFFPQKYSLLMVVGTAYRYIIDEPMRVMSMSVEIMSFLISTTEDH